MREVVYLSLIFTGTAVPEGEWEFCEESYWTMPGKTNP